MTKPTKPYTPTGKIVPFIEAMRDDPHRIWTIADIARVMGLQSNKVGGSLLYAERNGIVFRGKRNGLTVFRGVPFEFGGREPPPAKKKPSRIIQITGGWATPPDHIRIPKVIPGWTPPVMVAPRTSR